MNVTAASVSLRVFGLLMIGAGAILCLVNTFHSNSIPGSDTVNYGVMADRIVEMIGGGTLVVSGAIFFGFGSLPVVSHAPLPPSVPQVAPSVQSPVQPPSPPTGFPFAIADAVKYLPGDPAKTATSRAAYEAALRQKVKLATYPDHVVYWAWTNNVPQDRFAEWVDYIERVRLGKP